MAPATFRTSTISATCTAPIMKKAMPACAGTVPGVAVIEERIGTESSSMMDPPSTANSGARAHITRPLSQPTNSPRVPLNSASTTNSGPIATRMPSAILVVTRRPTVPSMNSIAPSHINPCGENAEKSVLLPLAS